MTTQFPAPVLAWHDDQQNGGLRERKVPLVVLLHGRGSNETDIIALAEHLPSGPDYVAVRAPIAERGGFAWFANRGIGRPIPESLAETMAWFRAWLEDTAPADRRVLLVGFSGGAAFAGGLILADPPRYAGAAILSGTLPFDAGVPTSPGRLAGLPVLVAQGDTDHVIPRPLLDRTWQYLNGDSGAKATTSRDPGGHGISAQTLTALQHWITELAVSTDEPER
jgi:phospholipase/carboxylesterase